MVWFRWLLSLLLLCSSVSAVDAAKKIRFPKKKPAALQEKDLAWHLPTQTQAQTWILWGWNDQGYMVTVFLISTRFLFVSRLGVQLTIRTPTGDVKHFVKEYTMDKVKGDSKRLLLRVAGKHKWDGGLKKGTVQVDYGKAGCLLKYERVLPGYRHMNGAMKFGSSVFEGITFAPRLTLQGSLRWGGKTIPFRGVGYADYSLQTITPKKLARRWYAARAAGPEYTVLAHHLLTIPAWKPDSLPGISIAKGKRWLFVSLPRHIQYFRAYHVDKDKKAGYHVPMRVVYKAKDDKGTQYKVDIQHKKQYVRLDLLGHVNPFLRFFIRRLLSNPFVYRYQAQLLLTIQEKNKPVVQKTLTAYTEWLFVQ